MNINVSLQTHVGARQYNEDAAGYDKDANVFIVADGMGGHANGDVASALTVDTVLTFFKSHLTDEAITWPHAEDQKQHFLENKSHAAVKLAHKIVAEHPHECGTTVVMVALDETTQQMAIAHVGDSRVYRLRGGTLECLTEDHSLYNELLKAGTELPDKKEFVYKNIITRAVGISPGQKPYTEVAPIEIDVQLIDVQQGDLYLLCTDGLYDPLSDALIKAHLSTLSESSLDPLCLGLVEAAFEHEGTDNITAMILHIT